MIETLDQLLAYPGPFLTADVAVQATSTNPILPEAMGQALAILHRQGLPPRQQLPLRQGLPPSPVESLGFQMEDGSKVVPAGATISVETRCDDNGNPVLAVGRVVEEGL